MSWDVGIQVVGVPWASYERNYTHNVNGMIRDALERAGIPLEFWPDSLAYQWRLARIARGATCLKLGSGTRICSMTCCPPSWWEMIDGRPGPDGLKMITAVIDQIEADPMHYWAMNPPNGWGNVNGLLDVFKDLRDHATTEAALVWFGQG